MLFHPSFVTVCQGVEKQLRALKGIIRLLLFCLRSVGLFSLSLHLLQLILSPLSAPLSFVLLSFHTNKVVFLSTLAADPFVRKSAWRHVYLAWLFYDYSSQKLSKRRGKINGNVILEMNVINRVPDLAIAAPRWKPVCIFKDKITLYMHNTEWPSD